MTVPSIDEALVAGLIADQFPQWARLPVVAASPQGWDNRTFRLGDALGVRLPSAPGYAHQVAQEHRWLPLLASRLPVPVPRPLGLGRPGRGYPFAWSVNAWLDGEVLSRSDAVDRVVVARELAQFLVALRGVAADDGPPAGPRTFYRGADLAVYADQARAAIAVLGAAGHDPVALRAVLDRALVSRWEGGPVWFHGDVAPDNLLVAGGHLAGVLDFGCSGVGDPACDLVIAWTALDAASRRVFRDAVGLDDATWDRARGWAVWKAAITLADPTSGRDRVREQRRALREILADSPQMRSLTAS
ncbi:aminoglycoside phosphotransferase family protein [Xylanimonas protaetiae]|uniref:aminoglycoside phosphotransferase family protein n=1 Tax=Xylanimonas protaetiae TaxID=2509457 RepID=UPI001F5E017F|nr:aminoglycoside phosphotransferase family protein [Xylanimonas protaetiae]